MGSIWALNPCEYHVFYDIPCNYKNLFNLDILCFSLANSKNHRLFVMFKIFDKDFMRNKLIYCKTIVVKSPSWWTFFLTWLCNETLPKCHFISDSKTTYHSDG